MELLFAAMGSASAQEGISVPIFVSHEILGVKLSFLISNPVAATVKSWAY